MNNIEVLQECKKAYYILTDLLDNCEYIHEEDTESVEGLKNRNKITNTISLLEDIYSSAWKNMRNNEEEKKLLETNLISPYGNKVIISDLISYCYLDEKEDENMFAIECETKKYKYEDFDTLEQARNEYIKVFGESREDIEEELSNNNENVVVCNELIKDIVECLNDYINENTERYWWE